MNQIYSITKVANLIGVTPETIKNWEAARLIPQASRMGLGKKRVFSQWKVQQILEFARANGYSVRSLEYGI